MALSPSSSDDKSTNLVGAAMFASRIPPDADDWETDADFENALNDQERRRAGTTEALAQQQLSRTLGRMNSMEDYRPGTATPTKPAVNVNPLRHTSSAYQTNPFLNPATSTSDDASSESQPAELRERSSPSLQDNPFLKDEDEVNTPEKAEAAAAWLKADADARAARARERSARQAAKAERAASDKAEQAETTSTLDTAARLATLDSSLCRGGAAEAAKAAIAARQIQKKAAETRAVQQEQPLGFVPIFICGWCMSRGK